MINSGTSVNSINYQLQAINRWGEITGQPPPRCDQALRHILMCCIKLDVLQGQSGTFIMAVYFFFLRTEETQLAKALYSHSFALSYLLLFSTQIWHSTWPSILEDFILAMLW